MILPISSNKGNVKYSVSCNNKALHSHTCPGFPRICLNSGTTLNLKLIPLLQTSSCHSEPLMLAPSSNVLKCNKNLFIQETISDIKGNRFS